MAKQEDSGHSFLAYFKRATSPLAVLRILSDRPMYGYELIQELKQRSGGKYQLSLLYPSCTGWRSRAISKSVPVRS